MTKDMMLIKILLWK